MTTSKDSRDEAEECPNCGSADGCVCALDGYMVTPPGILEEKDAKIKALEADLMLSQGEANGLEFKVKALEAENAHLKKAIGVDHTIVCASQEQKLNELITENAELREALKPFASTDRWNKKMHQAILPEKASIGVFWDYEVDKAKDALNRTRKPT